MADIIPFPQRDGHLLTRNLQRAFPLPKPSEELTLLMREAEALLGSMDDEQLDGWLDRLDRWEARHK